MQLKDKNMRFSGLIKKNCLESWAGSCLITLELLQGLENQQVQVVLALQQ